MYNFHSFLQDLSCSTGIEFNLMREDETPLYLSIKDEDCPKAAEVEINLANSKASLILPIQYENCTSLLKYTIENKYKEIFSMREQSLIDVLEGKEVSFEKVEKNFSFLSKGCTLFLINVDGSRYEALNIVRQLYIENEAVSFLYNDKIVVLGVFEEIDEHAKSIRESIVSDLYCKCYISYGNIIYGANNIKKAYEEAKECLLLSKNFDIKEEIFFYDKMLFEKIVYNIEDKVKRELLDKLKNKFDQFDSEIINTIEEFVNSDLNVSDAARRLYVHRNTLIYRLDKITKETGFDIRNFKEATIFIIAFLVWKESKQ